MKNLKAPTIEQAMLSDYPTLWYNDYLDMLVIVYPDVYTQETHYKMFGWTKESHASFGVLRAHYDFLGFIK